MRSARVERGRPFDLDMLEISHLGEDLRSGRHGVVPADHTLTTDVHWIMSQDARDLNADGADRGKPGGLGAAKEAEQAGQRADPSDGRPRQMDSLGVELPADLPQGEGVFVGRVAIMKTEAKSAGSRVSDVDEDVGVLGDELADLVAQLRG